MASTITSLGDILAPVTPESFFAETRYRKPLHVKASADKFADVMSWQILTDLVNQTSIWSAQTLQLVLDGRRIEPQEYCVPGVGRDQRPVMAPDLSKVKGWLSQGASMVCNDIDNLTPGLKATARALEEALGTKVQANLYCSWQAHPGFGSHFDYHEVFAVHVAGRKTWRLYERPIDDPINHPRFASLGRDFHEKNKGKLTQEVVLEPGDLLYIPRGWYHDAVATSEATIHIAFGATGPIGFDLLTRLFDRAVDDAAFRSNLPADRAALAERMADLGDRLSALCRDPALIDEFGAFVDSFRYQRSAITLPDDALVRRYRRAPSEIRMVRRQGTALLTDGRQGVPVPKGAEQPIEWVLSRPDFDETDFAAAFPAMPQAQRGKLLRDLAAMDVIRPA